MKIHMSLGQKFLIPTLTLIILSVSLVAVSSHISSRHLLNAMAAEQIGQLANMTDGRINAYLKDRKADITSWSRLKLFQSAVVDSFVGKSSRTAACEEFAKIQQDYKHFSLIGVATPTGDVVASSSESATGKVNIGESDYFKHSLQGEVFISDVTMSKSSGKYVFAVSAPVKEKDLVTGVLFGTVDLEVFSSLFVDSVKVGRNGYAFMFRNNGQVVAHPEKGNIMKATARDLMGEEPAASNAAGMSVRKDGDGEWMLFRQMNEALKWSLVIVADAGELLAPLKRLAVISMGIAAFSTVLAAVVILSLVGSIVKSIKRIVEKLTEGAEDVAEFSAKASETSQELSESASEQASALEETASSLEEMSSMTRNNADNAGQAESLVRKSVANFQESEAAVTNLASAMMEISQASLDTQKIVKTIDEIAFQTNLLALNAAVEAARAGEVGAGFAVVADEVRNLAMRAAEAAKNTAQLIDGTVSRVQGGSVHVQRATTAFAKVKSDSENIGKLVSEISASCEEQAQGIQQVSKAVSEIDGLTQRNAAGAEESASIASEMSSRAKQMEGMVGELTGLISRKHRKDADGSMERNAALSNARNMEAKQEIRIVSVQNNRRAALPR